MYLELKNIFSQVQAHQKHKIDTLLDKLRLKQTDTRQNDKYKKPKNCPKLEIFGLA